MRPRPPRTSGVMLSWRSEQLADPLAHGDHELVTPTRLVMTDAGATEVHQTC